MATLQQLETALRNADAAGDTDAATALASEIVKMRGSGASPDFAASVALPDVNLAKAQYDALPAWQKPLVAVDDMATLAGSGALFGFGEKGAAKIDEMLGRGSYEDRLAYQRRKTQDARDRSGVAGMVAEIGGGVAPAVKLAQMGVTATRLPGAIGRLGGLALDGAGYGALSAAGNDQDVMTGAALGGALGAGGQAAGNVLSTMARPITSRLFPDTAAARVMRDTLGTARMTPDQVADDLARASADGQGVYMAADALGHPGQRLASTIARTPNDGRTALVNALEGRQAGQGRRIATALSEGFAAPDTAMQRAASLRQSRGAAANVNYNAARSAAADVDVMPAVNEIDNMLYGGVKSAAGIGTDSIESALTGIRDRLVNADGSAQVIGFDEVLRLKQNLDDVIEQAVRGGQNNRARMLGTVRSQLDQALEAASQPYAAARNEFRKASKAIDAVDTGSAAAVRGRFEDTIPQFQRMSPEEQSAFRAGYADPLIAHTQGAATGVNKARPLINDATEREFPAFAAPGRGDQLGRRLRREQTMFETRNAALGGSKTADNLADDAALSIIDPSIIGNLLSGNLTGAAKNAILQGLSSLKGQPASVRERLARALMETNPTVARRELHAGVSRITKSENQRREIVRALMMIGIAGGAQAQK